MNEVLSFDWSCDSVDPHRRGVNDIQWAEDQPKGQPNYFVGDIVKFKVGGVGIITQANPPQSGWPSGYSCIPVKGKPFHKSGKYAWHYEGDFESLIGESPLRNSEFKR